MIYILRMNVKKCFPSNRNQTVIKYYKKTIEIYIKLCRIDNITEKFMSGNDECKVFSSYHLSEYSFVLRLSA